MWRRGWTLITSAAIGGGGLPTEDCCKFKFAGGLRGVCTSPTVRAGSTHAKTHNLSCCARNKFVTEQVCSNAVILSSCTKFVTRKLLTSCWLQPDNKLLEDTCNKAVEFIKLVASLLQACSNLVNKLGTTSASTCPVNKLLQHTCYKSAAGLLQVVRFYVCILHT